jgi:hypothetical protein
MHSKAVHRAMQMQPANSDRRTAKRHMTTSADILGRRWPLVDTSTEMAVFLQDSIS